MAGFTTKQFDDIVSDMVAYIIANSSSITDLSPGSVIRSFVEGSALSMEEIYVGIYLGFRRYLDNVQETAFDFERKNGTKAAVDVVFSRAIANGEITIPIGTRVKTASGLRFLTTEIGTIAAGQVNSNAVSCEAESAGSSYNIGSGTLTVLEDSIAGVDTVTNSLAATGGVDQESDIAYKTRFQAYIEGLGRSNIAGLTAGALSVEGITSVSVVELFPPVGNVNVDLYVDDGSAVEVSAAKVLEVQGVIDGDGTEDNPGYRSAGVNVVVQAPSIVTQDITMSVEVLSGVDTDQLENDIVDAVSGYVNTLGVGVDIIYNEIVGAIMGVYGVVDVDLTVPAANVTIAATQVGRAGTISVSLV